MKNILSSNELDQIFASICDVAPEILFAELITKNIAVILFVAGTDDETQEYDYLGAWGPRFDKLADMYGPGEETELEEE